MIFQAIGCQDLKKRAPDITLFVCLYCAVLTVSHRKISWHGTNRFLIINKGALLHCFFPHLDCAGKKAAPKKKKVNKYSLVSNRTGLTPVCNTPCSNMAFHQKRGIAKQHEPALPLFPSHFHFLWFLPTSVTSPNVSPRLKQILSVLAGKSADSQHKGRPVSVRGHRSAA